VATKTLALDVKVGEASNILFSNGWDILGKVSY
jgi:hypothetical protein